MKNYVLTFFLFLFTTTIFCQVNNKADSLLSQLELQEDTTQVYTYIDLLRLFESTAPDSSLFYGNEALNLSMNIGFKKGIAKSYREIAFINYMMGDLVLGIENYKNSLNAYRIIGDSVGVSRVSHNIGYFYYIIGDFPSALKYYQTALKCCEKNNKLESHKIMVLTNMGLLYTDIKEFEKAKSLYFSVLEMIEGTEDLSSLASIYSNLDVLYQRQDSLMLAKEYSQKALKIHTDLKDIPWIADGLYRLGQIYLNLKEYSKADSLQNASLQLSIQLNDKMALAKCYNEIGNIYYAQKEYKRSIASFKKSIENAKETETVRLLIEPNLQMAEAYKKIHEYKPALEYYELGTFYKDSILSEQNYKNSKELEIKYETEKKELQLKYQQEELAYQKQLIYLISGSSLILLLLIIALIIINQNRRKANSLLNKQKEELARKQKIIHQKNKDLEKLNILKDKIFVTIAHDLRSPVHSLQLALDLLENKNIGKEQFQEIASEIKDTVHLTANLIDNLLNWALIQIKGAKIEAQNIDLHLTAQNNISIVNSNIEKKNIEIINQVPKDQFAYTDLNMTNMVIRNLLSNAVKFTPSGGKITLSTKKQKNGLIEFSISDTGIGMSNDKVKTIFDPQSNISSVGTSGEKGSGIGLKLCKEFIHKTKNDIWVESEENVGTTFTFTLPEAKEQPDLQ